MERWCPHCGRINDSHDGPHPADKPVSGDVSLCWGCGGLGIFTDGGIRMPTQQEQAELEADSQVRAAQAAIRESYTPQQASALRWGQ